MKHLTIALSAALSLAIAAPLAQAQSMRGEFREQRQETRIEMGRLRGQLSAREYRDLQRGQERIDMLQRQARRDGVVTPWETQRIQREQAMQSRRIEMFRHNAETRRGGGPGWRR